MIRKIVQDLIKEGVHLEDKTVVGETPLDLAIKKRHWNIIELLLNNGANADFKDSNGSTLLIIASYHGCLDVVKVLIEQVRKQDEGSG